jgi:enterobactin synthetase component D
MTRRLQLCAPHVASETARIVRHDPHPLGPAVRQSMMPLGPLADLLREQDLRMLAPELGNCVRQRQLAFIAGRLCADAAIVAGGGDPAWLARGPSGQPLWPDNWCGSISHNMHWAAAIAQHQDSGCSLGIDVESIVSDEVLDAIAMLCLTGPERASVASAPDRKIDATLRFSGKEAYYKALFPRLGEYVDFLEMEIMDIDYRRGQFSISPVDNGHGRAPHLPPARGAFSVRDDDVVTWIRLSLAQERP